MDGKKIIFVVVVIFFFRNDGDDDDDDDFFPVAGPIKIRVQRVSLTRGSITGFTPSLPFR